MKAARVASLETVPLPVAALASAAAPGSENSVRQLVSVRFCPEAFVKLLPGMVPLWVSTAALERMLQGLRPEPGSCVAGRLMGEDTAKTLKIERFRSPPPQ
jgi:hypothetical protein